MESHLCGGGGGGRSCGALGECLLSSLNELIFQKDIPMCYIYNIYIGGGIIRQM